MYDMEIHRMLTIFGVTDLIPVIDLFAGPGGLGEGFSSVTDRNGCNLFKIVLSIECDTQTYRTLRLRSFLRQFSYHGEEIPSEYWDYIKTGNETYLEKLKSDFSDLWQEAERVARPYKLAIGDEAPAEYAKQRLKPYNIADNPWVLIGGPPCQAYSLVGRARQTNKEKLEHDEKQELYKCYLDFIEKLKPTIFVMENVVGMLSAKHYGNSIFQLVTQDMHDAGYTLRSLVVDEPSSPKDFEVHMELFGIPQRRHRVLLIGIRNDYAKTLRQHENSGFFLKKREPVTVQDVIGNMPPIRSSYSSHEEDALGLDWDGYIKDVAHHFMTECIVPNGSSELQTVIESTLPQSDRASVLPEPNRCVYSSWYREEFPSVSANLLIDYRSRGNMPLDLKRYLFCSTFAAANRKSPTLEQFPEELLPNHKSAALKSNQRTRSFTDRFKVQLADQPSTTMTCHLSKDGHYFIHYDPKQCRSLTVREAARLQTFPDNYYFCGLRTAKYHQIGNAVPPLLSQQIAQVTARMLGIDACTYFDSLGSRIAGPANPHLF